MVRLSLSKIFDFRYTSVSLDRFPLQTLAGFLQSCFRFLVHKIRGAASVRESRIERGSTFDHNDFFLCQIQKREGRDCDSLDRVYT